MSIFDKYGGWAFWEDAMDQLYERLRVDADLAHFFENANIVHIRQMIASLLNHALGIPSGDFPVDIKQAHRKLHIRAADYSKFVQLLIQLLLASGVEEEDLHEVSEALQAMQGEVVLA